MANLQQQMRDLASSYTLDTFQLRGALMEGAALIDIQEQLIAHVQQERNELAERINQLRGYGLAS